MSRHDAEQLRYVSTFTFFSAGSRWVRETIHRRVRAAGYGDLNPAHIRVFRYSPTIDGRSPSEIAADMGITKQSIQALLDHLQERGYLFREVDPSNKRIRIIRLTRKGQYLEDEIIGQARRLEQAMQQMLGETQFRQLRMGLEKLMPMLSASDDGTARGQEASAPQRGGRGLRHSFQAEQRLLG
jgi:DNA-binding MarR family transcriptional regulator